MSTRDASRAQEYRDRCKALGITRVTLVVPKDKVDVLQAVADLWLAEHKVKKLTESGTTREFEEAVTFLKAKRGGK